MASSTSTAVQREPMALFFALRHRLTRRESPVTYSTPAYDGALFDRPVGALQDGLREGDAKGPGGLEVDDQVDIARLLDRHLARARALEDAVHVDRNAPESLLHAGRVDHQT